MGKPCLYYALFSPPARACIITAKLIGLDVDLRLVDFSKKEHLSEEFVKLNPQHQIPVFVDDDDEVYIDSHAIMCFMVAKYAKDDSLYPKDIKMRAHVDHLLHFENGVLFQVIKDIVCLSSVEMGKSCLYYALFSPPSRACMITAKLIGLDLDLRLVDFTKKEHLSKEFLKLNPQHQIPVFVDNDGEAYMDSHAIMCFMVSKYAKNDSLYPKDLKLRARVDHLLYFENGVMFQVIKYIVARNIYGGEGEFNPKTLEMCHNAYGFLESYLNKGGYVVGDKLTIADVSNDTTMVTLNQLIPVTQEKYPNICAWMERMKSLPGYDDINIPGAEALCARINSMMEQHRKKTA